LGTVVNFPFPEDEVNKAFPVSVLSAALLAACGGPMNDAGAPDATPGVDAAAAKTAPPTGTNPLPTAPPAADVVIRESFGFGPDFIRPTGGKGTLKSVFGNVDGFWVEWPGSGRMAWAAAQGGWSFAGCSTDVLELASPLQTVFNGCVVSSWADQVVRFPSALVPFAGLAGRYEVSADVIPAALVGSTVAVGLTSAAGTVANLRTSGQVSLALTPDPVLDGMHARFELRLGGLPGTVLAAGPVTLSGYNPIALQVDPVAGTVSATVNGVAYGPFAAPGIAPRYVAMEGQGVLDNFVVRALP
jgi:hypothetical protein